MAVGFATRASRENDVIAAIDVGASKAVCLIAHLASSADGARIPEIVGVGTQGGAPHDRNGGAHAAETALRAAVDAAERMAGERVKAVHIGIGGRHLHCRRVGVDLDIEGGRVTQEDIADCLREGANAAAADGYTAIHALPIGFSIDGEDAGSDPAGLAGTLLTTGILGVGCRDSHLFNLESLVERCGLRLADQIAAPLAAAEAVLLEDEKELGVVMIDIGASDTSYAVFERGALVECGGVPVGGGHITRDIAQLFGAPLAQAERIKTLYGAAFTGSGDENKLVDVQQLGESRDVLRVSRAEISAVITPRLEEILELTAKRLAGAEKSRRSIRRVVLTGGGSLLVGTRETAERVLAMKARVGRPTAVAGAPDAATAPQFSACVGLIQLVAAQRTQRRERGLAAGTPMQVAAGGVFAGMGQWLRDNF